MSVFEKGLITILGCALLFALLAVPLILRRIPRNPVYGFRTGSTLRDESVWYEANAHFGRGLLVAAIVSAVATLILYFAGGLAPALFLKASIVALVAPLFVAILATSRFVRSLILSSRARN
jgi:uncharacterized membrane protein